MVLGANSLRDPTTKGIIPLSTYLTVANNEWFGLRGRDAIPLTSCS